MKVLKIIQLVLWTGITVALAGLLVFMLSTKSRFSFVSWPSFGDYSAQLYSHTFQTADIEKIVLDTSSANIIFTASSDNQIQVICLGSQTLKNNNPIKVTNDNGVLTVHQESILSTFPFFNLGDQIKVEIALPPTYAKDLEITNTSGNVTFADDITFGKVNLSITSGNLNSKALTADSLKEYTMSGDTTLDTLTASSYSLQSLSGNITINNLSGAGSIKSTSGNVNVSMAAMTGTVNISLTSGDLNISLAKGIAADISANCVSGNIRTNIPLSYPDNRSSATGKVGSGPSHDLSATTTSGNINLQQKQ